MKNSVFREEERSLEQLTLKEVEDREGDDNEPLSAKTLNKYFKIEKRLYPFRGILPSFFSSPICAFK